MIIIVASTSASTRPDPRGRGQDPRGRGQDPRGRGHKMLTSRGLEAETRPRDLTSLIIRCIIFIQAFLRYGLFYQKFYQGSEWNNASVEERECGLTPTGRKASPYKVQNSCTLWVRSSESKFLGFEVISFKLKNQRHADVLIHPNKFIILELWVGQSVSVGKVQGKEQLRYNIICEV